MTTPSLQKNRTGKTTLQTGFPSIMSGTKGEYNAPHVSMPATAKELVKLHYKVVSLLKMMLCPKLGGVAGPFSLAGLLNWGGAKTGNWRVDKNRDDQGTMEWTDGDLETEERLMTKSLIRSV